MPRRSLAAKSAKISQSARRMTTSYDVECSPSEVPVQARGLRGGARLDGEVEKCADGAPWRDSATLPSILCANTVELQGCGVAHCDVVAARQQSWLQQPVLWTAERFDSAAARRWHWCVLRMQQACAGAVVAASASGTRFPTSATSSRNLAVRRCMLSEGCEPQGGESIEHKPQWAQLALPKYTFGS